MAYAPPMTRRLLHVAATLGVVVLAGWGAVAGVASANVGVGITAATITLAKPVAAGTTAKAPGVYVVNTGTQGGVVHLKVSDMEHTKHHVVPASWVRFDPSSVNLDPKKGTVVPFTVSVPKEAATGAYQSDLVATATSAGQATGTGTQVGAAAATRLTFTVVPAPASSDPHIPTWVWIALGAVVLIGLVVWAVRASGVRLHVERTPSSKD